MHERDERPWEELRETLLWSQRDAFWQGNILSAEKLRKQYDLLRAQMGRPEAAAKSARDDVRVGYAFPETEGWVEGDAL